MAEDLAKEFTDEPIYVAGIGQGSGRGLHANEALTYKGIIRLLEGGHGVTASDDTIRRWLTLVREGR